MPTHPPQSQVRATASASGFILSKKYKGGTWEALRIMEKHKQKNC